MSGPENANIAFPRLIPGPFQGKAWLVTECDARDAATVVGARTLQVPRITTQQDLGTHLHELAHIERHNGDVPVNYGCNGVPMFDMFRLMLEEIAIETIKYQQGYGSLMYRIRDHYDWTSFPFPQARHDLAGMWLQLAGSIPHTENTDLRVYFESIHKLTRPDDYRILRECLGDMQSDTSHHNCMKWSGLLTAHFTPPADPPKRPDKKTQEQQDAEQEQSELDDEKTEAARQRDGDADDDSTEGKEHQTVRTSKGTVDVHRHTAGRRGKVAPAPRWSATDSGGYVRYPQNLYRGARIFGIKTRGGSILVDVSVSMEWSPGQLQAASRTLPQLWVAAYDEHSNIRHGRPNAHVARLCIVASNGRIGDLNVLDEPEHTGYNCDTGADFAVLEWAIRNAPKPLVWVSDGAVSSNPAGAAEVDALTKRHKIPRVATIGDAIKFLSGGTVYGWNGVIRQASNGTWQAPAPIRYHR